MAAAYDKHRPETTVKQNFPDSAVRLLYAARDLVIRFIPFLMSKFKWLFVGSETPADSVTRSAHGRGHFFECAAIFVRHHITRMRDKSIFGASLLSGAVYVVQKLNCAEYTYAYLKGAGAYNIFSLAKSMHDKRP